MFEPNAEIDAAAALLERRWFAAIAAVKTLQAQCEALREVMQISAHAWRRARSELARVESLCEAFGEALAERDALHEQPSGRSIRSSAVRPISSAA